MVAWAMYGGLWCFKNKQTKHWELMTGKGSSGRLGPSGSAPIGAGRPLTSFDGHAPRGADIWISAPAQVLLTYAAHVAPLCFLAPGKSSVETIPPSFPRLHAHL